MCMLHNIYIVSTCIKTSPYLRLFTRYRAHSVTDLIINGAQRITNFVAASSPSHIFIYYKIYIHYNMCAALFYRRFRYQIVLFNLVNGLYMSMCIVTALEKYFSKVFGV